jgi:hypothetical protein
MFTASSPSLFLEYFRVPAANLDLESSLTVRLEAPATGRAVSHPRGSSGAPPRTLGAIRIYVETLSDQAVEALLPPGAWTRQEAIAAEDGTVVSHVWRDDRGNVFLPFDPDAAIVNLWSEAYRAAERAGGLRRLALRAYYNLKPALPRALQIGLRRRLARMQARRSFPRWPAETALHDLYAWLFARLAEVAGEDVPWIAPWPGPYRWALVLTHDVEQQVGCDNVGLLRAVEERHGFRSAWNFVPRRYVTPDETVADLTAHGFEVGVHGLYHDGRDLASRKVLEERLPAMRAAAERWGATGFRSPATHRSWELMPLLGFEHDSSYFDTDPFEPQAGGSCTWWPFPVGDMVELPITLLMDHTLFVILRNDERVWLDKASFLRQRGGMALVITHPDYFLEQQQLDVYDRFLAAYADDETVWRALPRDVAAWWRRRAASSIVRDGGGWRVEGPAADEARVLFGPDV